MTRPLRADQRHLVASEAKKALRHLRRDMPALDELAIARAAEQRRAADARARTELEERSAADARVAEEALRGHIGCKGVRCTRPGCRGGVPAPGPRSETDLLELPHAHLERSLVASEVRHFAQCDLARLAFERWPRPRPADRLDDVGRPVAPAAPRSAHHRLA